MDEFKRKLASIRKISEVLPIDGADNIELVKIDGWQCVTKKDEFSTGDLCVYFEIDSFLPICPEFEFLRKSSYRKMGDKEGFRLKTIRLRGQISQGLALRIEIFLNNANYETLLLDNGMSSHENSSDIHEPGELTNITFGYSFNEKIIGLDATEVLGVEKYDPPIQAQLAGIAKGNFPSFIRKTDQERVQNIWEKIKDSKESFEVTVKLDGTSCTYYLNDGVFGVCSRNLELIESESNILWKIAKECKIEEILRVFNKNMAFQGEVIGEGIQGNPERIKGQGFYLFDVWDIDNNCYYKPKERDGYFNRMNFGLFDPRNFLFDKINIIPALYKNLTLENFNCLDDLLIFANGKSLKSDIREGLVFKSNDSGLTFKVISNEYLLKEKS